MLQIVPCGWITLYSPYFFFLKYISLKCWQKFSSAAVFDFSVSADVSQTSVLVALVSISTFPALFSFPTTTIHPRRFPSPLLRPEKSQRVVLKTFPERGGQKKNRCMYTHRNCDVKPI